jgi:hypothetical protein
MEEYYGLGVAGMEFLLMAYYQVVMFFSVGFPIHHKMKLHMNTNIMGLHTKLTNLVFNEIDRHLDRLNLTEELAPKNSPKSHNQEHENEVTPSFLSWWTGCCMIVYTGGRLQPGDWWLVTFDIPRLLIKCCWCW